MSHVFNHTLAVVAACVLAFGSIGAIITVSLEQVADTRALAAPEIA
jgi:hypothetical protein